jgi:ankyrin repeat protein
MTPNKIKWLSIMNPRRNAAPRFAASALAVMLGGPGMIFAQTQSAPNGATDRAGAEHAVTRKAAGTTSYLFGNVGDFHGVSLVAALVTITNEQTKEVYPVATDKKGNFRVLLSGDYSYELRVEYPGFPAFVQSGINLRAGGDTRWDVELRVDPVRDASRVMQYQQPLIRAVQAEYTDQVASLLRRGADVNQAEDDGTTALHVAVLREREDIIETLLKAGANPNAVNDRGENVLFLVHNDDDNDLIEFVLKIGANIDQADVAGKTPLIRFAQWDEDDRLQFFVDAGADLNAQDRDGNTALMVAAAKGNDSAVKVLLQAGADPGLKNAAGKTALDLALASEDEWTIDLLRAAADAPRPVPEIPQKPTTTVERKD